MAADVNNSANMNLPVPETGITTGPDWANDINDSLTIIDAHNHAPGSGVQITPAGLNINAALSLNSNSLTNVSSVAFVSQALAISTLTSTYVVGKELFYTDGAGNQVQITSNGSVVGTPGSITGLTPPASVTYASSTFIFESDVNTAANIDVASVLLRDPTAGSPALTLSPPASMSSDYTLTLPFTPASTLPIVMSAGGNMSAQALTVSQLAAEVAQALNPSGSIIAYGGAVAPAGYLLCDGSAVSRTTYSALFAAISTAYGAGNGSTTFNLPDLRGMFMRGVTGSSSNDPDASSRTANNAGGNAGNLIGSQQADSLQGHAHTLLYNLFTNNSGPFNAYNAAQTDSTTETTLSIVSDGVNGTPRYGLETRSKNVYVNYCIKT